MCNLFVAVEPLGGCGKVQFSERKTKQDWALFVREIARLYPKAEKITLVMDNYQTHGAAALYETFPPPEAKANNGWKTRCDIEAPAMVPPQQAQIDPLVTGAE